MGSPYNFLIYKYIMVDTQVGLCKQLKREFRQYLADIDDQLSQCAGTVEDKAAKVKDVQLKVQTAERHARTMEGVIAAVGPVAERKKYTEKLKALKEDLNQAKLRYFSFQKQLMKDSGYAGEEETDENDRRRLLNNDRELQNQGDIAAGLERKAAEGA
jgi:hypothetical protein